MARCLTRCPSCTYRTIICGEVFVVSCSRMLAIPTLVSRIMARPATLVWAVAAALVAVGSSPQASWPASVGAVSIASQPAVLQAAAVNTPHSVLGAGAGGGSGGSAFSKARGREAVSDLGGSPADAADAAALSHLRQQVVVLLDMFASNFTALAGSCLPPGGAHCSFDDRAADHQHIPLLPTAAAAAGTVLSFNDSAAVVFGAVLRGYGIRAPRVLAVSQLELRHVKQRDDQPLAVLAVPASPLDVGVARMDRMNSSYSKQRHVRDEGPNHHQRRQDNDGGDNEANSGNDDESVAGLFLRLLDDVSRRRHLAASSTSAAVAHTTQPPTDAVSGKGGHQRVDHTGAQGVEGSVTHSDMSASAKSQTRAKPASFVQVCESPVTRSLASRCCCFSSTHRCTHHGCLLAVLSAWPCCFAALTLGSSLLAMAAFARWRSPWTQHTCTPG